METFFLLLCACSVGAFSPSPSGLRGMMTVAGNSDMFGSTSRDTPKISETSATTPGSFTNSFKDMNSGADHFKTQAEKLRQEAAEMELALREEARAKGLPQKVIDKLIPMQSKSKAKSAKGTEGTVMEKPFVALPVADVRKKLGYLNTGDAVRFTSELNRLRGKGVVNLWGKSGEFGRESFAINNYQLQSRTKIEPADLRLDDVGFEYQKVFFIALGIASVLALASNAVGGQLGFILGYLSALFPVGLVGIGSIAPQLIGAVLNRFEYATNEESKERYVAMNAGKFLVGYLCGLPVANFKTGGPSNEVDFFQLRPSGSSEKDDSNLFQKRSFKQVDIARASVMCVSGPTAECMKYKIASGNTPGDVNTLYELMNSVEPALSPDAVQNHIRWSVCAAFDILKTYPSEYERLVEAFRRGDSLEDCIACIEGK